MNLLAKIGLMTVKDHNKRCEDMVKQFNEHMATQIEIQCASVDETIQQIIDTTLEVNHISAENRKPVVIRFEFPFSFVWGLAKGSEEVAHFIVDRITKIVGRKMMAALDQGLAREQVEDVGPNGNYL